MRQRLRKLLDWRKLLIYSHRWLGIGITVMFLVWTLSGVVLMYYGHPQITTGERLLRLEPIDFSTATVTPAQAAAKAGIKPYRVRLSMYEGRPGVPAHPEQHRQLVRCLCGHG